MAEGIGRTPAALAMKLTNIASLDPKVTSTGRRGLTGASAADREMWTEMHNDWEAFAIKSELAAEAVHLREDEAEQSTGVEADQGPLGEDQTVISTTRVGQRFFRDTVLAAYNERCCITGLSIPSVLVASHIIPWRCDKSNRVNPRNGLLLSALHDKAFDIGLITVDDDMTVRVSDQYARSRDQFFSESIQFYHGREITLPEKFPPSRDFLGYHRANIFKG